jgi:23S rRNA-/tRNA-specific pseudouridylate synthase
MRFHSNLSGERLGAVISDHLGLSRALVKRSIDRGGCRVNGTVERFASYRIKKGDAIDFELIAPEKHSMQILFEDEDLIVFNKGVGILSDHPLAVHRLDKPTSGVLVRAKHEKAKLAMEDLFRKREVHKIYHAHILGSPSEAEGTFQDTLILKGTFEGQKMWGVGLGGKEAVTHYRILKKGKISTIELSPITGRTHQLRVQLSHRGYPILGDTQYGRHSKAGFGYSRLMLHAHSIAFKHPLKGIDLVLVAESSESFREAK